MWTCSKCGESVQEDFELCWSCGTNRAGVENPAFDPEREGIVGDQAYRAQQEAKKEENVVTVATFGNAPEAHMARSRLEAEGIHAFVTNELAGTAWGLLHSPDGVHLQVTAKDAARARQVLAGIHHSQSTDRDDAEEDENEEHIQADRQSITAKAPEDVVDLDKKEDTI